MAPPLDEHTAAAALPAGRLVALKENGLVRLSLGQVEPVSARHLDLVKHALSPDDLLDLEIVRKLAHVPTCGALWISADDLQACHHAHRVVHESTPELARLVEAPLFAPSEREGRSGYVLDLGAAEGATWPTRLVIEAGARLWTTVARSTTPEHDSTSMREWLLKMTRADGIVDTPRFLSRDLRERFLDAAHATILADESLVDFAGEAKLQLAGRVPPLTLPALHPEATAAGRYRWWEDFENGTRIEPYDEARPLINALVATIVRYDRSDGGWYTAYRRIIELLSAGATKAYLAGLLPLLIANSRPEATAALFSEQDTLALGLILLSGLRIVEASTMDSFELREARSHSRKLFLLREALELFRCSLVTSRPPNADGTRASAAMAILETLQAFARDCDRGVDNARSEAARLRCEEIYSLTANTIGAATPDAPVIVPGHPSYQSYVVTAEAQSLVDLSAAVSTAANVVSDLKVHHELLRFVTEHQQAFAPYPEGTFAALRMTIVGRIVERYGHALELGKADASFRHHFRRPALTSIPWEATACALFETDGLGAWLHLPELKKKILDLPEQAGDRQREDVIAGCAARLRAHLEVLHTAHRRLPKFTGAKRAARDSVRRELETAITELVTSGTAVARGSVDLFDRRAAIGQHNDVAEVASHAAVVIPAFSNSSGPVVLERWVARTEDPLILLKIEAAVELPLIKQLVRRRLADDAILAKADGESWFDSLTQMAADAAAANQRDVADRLLARGDRVAEKHPWRAKWERAAFRARLLLSYHQRDSQAIGALPMPSTAVGDTQAAQDQRRVLESSRAFYEALLMIDTEPAKARGLFESQLSSQPDSPSLLANIFAAELRSAKMLENPAERRDAYETALRSWERTLAAYPRPELLDPGGPNTFIALDEAQLDDEFDARWRALDEADRCRRDTMLVSSREPDAPGSHRGPRLAPRTRLRNSSATPRPTYVARGEKNGPSVTTKIALSTEDYRRYWNDIRGLTPSDIASVLGGTTARSVEDFILDIHVAAVKELLKRLPDIDKLKDENKVNDLVGALIQMRISHLGWTLCDQSRAGSTYTAASKASRDASGVNERDWVIRDGLGDFVLSEALRLSSVETAKIDEHMVKVAGRYNPDGALLTVVLVYFEGSDFSSFVDRYREHVSHVALPDWQLISAEPKDQFGSQIRCLRLEYRNAGLRFVQDHIALNLGPKRSTALEDEDSAEG